MRSSYPNLSQLRTAGFVLPVLLSVTTLCAQTSTSAIAPSAEAPVQLGAMTVTGSHISRLDAESPQPVLSYTSDDIATSGFQSLGDFLQAQSFNSGGDNSLLQTSTSGVGLSFSRGATTLNPRGLGAGNYLVLVDGRRISGYANPDTNSASVFDINSLPASAIDRVDFLKDGASAIYGSDAITGVMNIVLKKSFDGVEVDASVGGATNNPTVLTRRSDIMIGANTPKTAVLVDLSWFKQAGSSIHDYSRSPNGNFAAYYGIKGNNTLSTQAYPLNVSLTAAQATTAGLTTGAGYYVISDGQPTATPTLGSFKNVGTVSTNIPNIDRNDLTPQGLVPHLQRWNLFANLRHDFNDRLSGFAQIIGSDEQTNYLYAPLSYANTSVNVSQIFETAIPNNAQGGIAIPALIIPAGNPFNPFKSNLTSFLGRIPPDRTRRFEVESLAATLVAGLNGKLAGDWTWQSSFTYGHDAFSQVQQNSLRPDDFQNALNGTFYGFSGVYFNPYGPSDKKLLDALFYNSTNIYKSTDYAYDLSTTGSLFAMPELAGLPSAGSVGLAAGVEWHQNRINAAPDSSNQIGTNNGGVFLGSRTVTSEYVELDAPILKRYLELQLAARHEQYSDFGGTTKSKLALGSQLTSFFKLRGSYSQSFKAPDLGQLDGGGIRYSAATTDPLNPSLPSQKYQEILHPNPNLKPEEGRTIYMGGIFDLSKMVKGLSLTIDYTNITINHAVIPILNFTPAQLFTYFPNLVFRNPNTNQITYIDLTPINGSAYYYRGFDFALNYSLRNTRAGDFKLGVQATRVLYLGYNAGTGQGITNYVGHYGFGGEVQRWTGNAQLSWIFKGFNSTLAAIYKGPVLDDADGTVAANTAWGVNPIVLLNLTVSHPGPWGTNLTLGCNNLLNTAPPQDGYISGFAGFDIASYGAWAVGRFVSLKVAKKF